MTISERLSRIRPLLARVVSDAPRFMLAALKSKTGRAIAGSVIAWGSSRVGLDWPQQEIAKAFSFLDLKIGASTVSDMVSAGFLTFGTLFANEKWEHIRSKAYPNRWYVTQESRVPFTVRVLPFIVDGKAQPMQVEYYEIDKGMLYGVSHRYRSLVDPSKYPNHGPIFQLLAERSHDAA